MITPEERELRGKCNCLRNGLGCFKQLQNWIRVDFDYFYSGTELGKYFWQHSITIEDVIERLQVKLSKLEDDIRKIKDETEGCES